MRNKQKESAVVTQEQLLESVQKIHALADNLKDGIEKTGNVALHAPDAATLLKMKAFSSDYKRKKPKASGREVTRATFKEFGVKIVPEHIRSESKT